jgi:hypothetical protein
MASIGAYELGYTEQDRIAVRRELHIMRADPALRHDYPRLLRVLQDIVDRGPKARDENIHLASVSPPLHLVSVGTCAAFYAYGSWYGATRLFLLGFYSKKSHLRRVGTVAERLVNVR